MWRDLVIAAKPNVGPKKTASLPLPVQRARYQTLLDLTPLYGNLRLLRRLDVLEGVALRKFEDRINYINSSNDVALQSYDVKMDRIYKSVTALIESKKPLN